MIIYPDNDVVHRSNILVYLRQKRTYIDRTTYGPRQL